MVRQCSLSPESIKILSNLFFRLIKCQIKKRKNGASKNIDFIG